MASRIEDYAMIGDCETAALVGRDGSIDWFCPRSFDAPACFAALLGTDDNGRWQIRPAGEIRKTSRCYRDNTLVLETRFETDEGEAAVIDFMPLRPDVSEIIRVVEGRRGKVAMQMDLAIRFDYGSIVPWVNRRDDGIWSIAGPDALQLSTDVKVHSENFRTKAEFTVDERQSASFVLTWYPSHHAKPVKSDAHKALKATEKWWHKWASKCTYDGKWQDAVLRSLITLKALTYEPTGGLVAAATTSLPERIGGDRNWDYRFCWLRDATFSLYALMEGGYTEEAVAWREWLVRAVAGEPSELQIMYSLTGERRLTELELDWLSGYENSRPVRIGNAACRQHQLDVYGEVMDALHFARETGLEENPNVWRIQQAMMDFLESDWRNPDEGIWEVRGPARHFTHSKVMAWVAADRAVKSIERFGLDGPLDRWKAMREAIHAEVCEKGFNAELNSFVQSYGSKALDASLLMLPQVGFLPIDDPRILGTIDAIQKGLMRGGFLERYLRQPTVDGLSTSEGTFLLCTFWLVDCLALAGRRDEATDLFGRLLALRNDVGLLSEEYEPRSQRMLGNFPQAFSHIGLINSARNLSRSGGSAERRQQR